MRIMKIRTWKDFGKWCRDQVLHGLIALAGIVPVLVHPDHHGAAVSSALLLLIREGEQARETVEEWLAARRDRSLYAPSRVTWLCLLDDLHLPDRIGDVVFGTILATTVIYFAV